MAAAESVRAGLHLDRLFRTAAVIVPLGVLGNLAFTLWTTERNTLQALAAFPRRYLIFAVLLGLVPWFTNALRLVIWTRFVGQGLSMREALRIVLGAEVGSSLLPTSTGGELIRWGMLTQRGIPAGAAGSIISLGYLEDSLFFLFALPTAFVLSDAGRLPILRALANEFRTDATRAVAVALGVLFGLGLLLWLIFHGWFSRRARRTAQRAYVRLRRRLRRSWRDAQAVYSLVARRGKLRFLVTWILGMIQWSCRYSVITALVAFLGAPINPLLSFLLQWVIFTAMIFVPTPGATGGAEAAFFLIYKALLPADIIGLATAGWRFFTFYLQLGLGALFFALLGTLKQR